jgi:hypothetical protein
MFRTVVEELGGIAGQVGRVRARALAGEERKQERGFRCYGTSPHNDFGNTMKALPGANSTKWVLTEIRGIRPQLHRVSVHPAGWRTGAAMAAPSRLPHGLPDGLGIHTIPLTARWYVGEVALRCNSLPPSIHGLQRIME